MPIYRLSPSFGLGGNEVAYVKARSPRAAVKYWYCSNTVYKVKRFPLSRGYKVYKDERDTDDWPYEHFYVRVAKMPSTEKYKQFVEE